MKIITITGYKGGVGKSTTAIHLAEFFSTKGATLLIDSDPNRTSLEWKNRSERLRFEVLSEREAIKQISRFEFVIIDTPARPNSDDIRELAEGCDLLILPTKPDIVSLEPMLETARAIPNGKYRILLTIVPPYPSKEGEILRNDLKESGMPVFQSMIRRTVGFEKAALTGKTISHLEEHRFVSAWQDYVELGEEIQEEIQ